MFGLSLAIVAISSRSPIESERVARLRMVWTKAAFGGDLRRIGLRADRQAPGQRLLRRRQRLQDLILGDIVVAGDGGSRADGKRGANGRDRKDRGQISASRDFRHCQSLLRNERGSNIGSNQSRCN